MSYRPDKVSNKTVPFEYEQRLKSDKEYQTLLKQVVGLNDEHKGMFESLDETASKLKAKDRELRSLDKELRHLLDCRSLGDAKRKLEEQEKAHTALMAKVHDTADSLSTADELEKPQNEFTKVVSEAPGRLSVELEEGVLDVEYDSALLQRATFSSKESFDVAQLLRDCNRANVRSSRVRVRLFLCAVQRELCVRAAMRKELEEYRRTGCAENEAYFGHARCKVEFVVPLDSRPAFLVSGDGRTQRVESLKNVDFLR